MNDAKNTILAWQAGTMNESAYKYLCLFCLSWELFMFVVATRYGYILGPSLIAICFAIYYWNERTNLGVQYLHDHS